MTKTESASPAQVLNDIVEPRRKRAHISLRTAAQRAGMAEGTWRQLAARGVRQNGRWYERRARRDQVLAMAHAVGVIDDAARALGATQDEIRDATASVVINDPAVEEIMSLRHLRPNEKLLLIEALEEMRDEAHPDAS